MVVKELLKLLVAEVDAKLLKAIVVEDLKPGDVEDADKCDPDNKTDWDPLPLR